MWYANADSYPQVVCNLLPAGWAGTTGGPACCKRKSDRMAARLCQSRNPHEPGTYNVGQRCQCSCKQPSVPTCCWQWKSLLRVAAVALHLQDCWCLACDERFAPAQVVTLSSDIFSFGLVLWEVRPLLCRLSCQLSCCLNDCSCYQTAVSPVLQIVTGKTPTSRGKLPMPDTPSACPADIWGLIEQCLLLKPEDRPPAKEVVHDLQFTYTDIVTVENEHLRGLLLK